MRTKRIYYPGLMLLLLTLLLLFSAFSSSRLYASSLHVQAHSAVGATTYPASASTAATTNWANVRIGPGTNYDIANTYAPGTSVTIYATVSGEVVWNVVVACRYFKSRKAEKVASRDKGGHCQRCYIAE